MKPSITLNVANTGSVVFAEGVVYYKCMDSIQVEKEKQSKSVDSMINAVQRENATIILYI